MAKRSGTFNVTYGSHGILWWLLIGWWWRPIKGICCFLLADLLGFKYISKRKRK